MLQKKDANDWVEEYGDKLYNYALARVKDPETAEDLVQETFLSAFKAYDAFEGRSTVSTWLISILRNKIIDYVRKLARQPSDATPTEEIEILPAKGFSKLGIWNIYVSNWAKSADQKIEDQEFLNTLEDCFKKLPKKYSKVFSLKFIKDVDSEEICKVLDISPSNYWVLLHRGRLALRDCLEKNWYKK